MSVQQIAIIDALETLLEETRRLRDQTRANNPASQRLGILERDVIRLEREIEKVNR